MIRSFSHKGLELFYYTGNVKGIKPEHSKKLGKILDRLNASVEVRDMNYPGSGLHLLKGKYRGKYSVSVSGNWRIVFEFIKGDAYLVDYCDYH